MARAFKELKRRESDKIQQYNIYVITKRKRQFIRISLNNEPYCIVYHCNEPTL